MTDAEKAQLVALELIRRQLVDLPLAIAANTARAAAPGGQTPAAKQTLADAMRAAAPEGSAWNPYQLPPLPQARRAPGPLGRVREAFTETRVGRTALAVGRTAGQGIGGVLSALAQRFGQLIGPVAALSAVVSANTSGFQIIGSAMKLLGSILATAILPIAVLLATALVAVSDAIWKKILPNLDKYAAAFAGLMPVVDLLASAFGMLADVVVWVARQFGKLPNPVAWAERQGDRLRGARDAVIGALPDRASLPELPEAKEWARDLKDAVGDALGDAGRWLGRIGRTALFGGGPGEASPSPPAAGTPPAARRQELDDVLKALRLSMGPQASIGSLTGVRNAAMLAALQGDPIQQRMLRVQEQTLQAIERGFADARPAAAGVVGWTPNGGAGEKK